MRPSDPTFTIPPRHPLRRIHLCALAGKPTDHYPIHHQQRQWMRLWALQLPAQPFYGPTNGKLRHRRTRRPPLDPALKRARDQLDHTIQQLARAGQLRTELPEGANIAFFRTDHERPERGHR